MRSMPPSSAIPIRGVPPVKIAFITSLLRLIEKCNFKLFFSSQESTKRKSPAKQLSPFLSWRNRVTKLRLISSSTKKQAEQPWSAFLSESYHFWTRRMLFSREESSELLKTDAITAGAAGPWTGRRREGDLISCKRNMVIKVEWPRGSRGSVIFRFLGLLNSSWRPHLAPTEK